MAILTAQCSERRRASLAATAGEPAYPLGPRFAGPRQGLARDGSAPLRSPRHPRSGGVRGRGSRPFPPWRRVLMADHRTVTATTRVSPAELADWWAKAQDRGRRRAARSLVSCTAQSRKLEWKPCGTTATHASEQPVQPFPLCQRPPAPERQHRSGGRVATAREPAIYGSAGTHMGMAFRCTCTPMSDVHAPISTDPRRSAFKIGLQGAVSSAMSRSRGSSFRESRIGGGRSARRSA